MALENQASSDRAGYRIPVQITESGHVDLARVRWFTSSEVGAAISLKSIWRGRDRCRLWLWPQAALRIFLGAPFVEALRGNRALGGALSAITAAVVGVILNLAIWFALHVIFQELVEVRALGMTLEAPVLGTVNLLALALSVGAVLAVFRFKIGMVPTLVASAFLGLCWHLLATGYQ